MHAADVVKLLEPEDPKCPAGPVFDSKSTAAHEADGRTFFGRERPNLDTWSKQWFFKHKKAIGDPKI